MAVLFFDRFVKEQIKKILDYSNQNVFDSDDILDMMNNQMKTPGATPEHLVLVPIGRWICYYIVEHPIKGLCHYLCFKPDASGKLPNKEFIEYTMKEFEIGKNLLDEYITEDKEIKETTVVIPIQN